MVVYDPEYDLVSDLVACEDPHVQERAVMQELIEPTQPGELSIADRQFSTSAILWGIANRDAKFLIREHGANPNPTELGPHKKRGDVESGQVFSQDVEGPEGQRLRMRRIVLHLVQPTEDGEMAIRILTNTSIRQLSACNAARMTDSAGASKECLKGSIPRCRASCARSVVREPLAFAVSVAALQRAGFGPARSRCRASSRQDRFELSF